mmetsp:Transcript_47273/g.110180  ORF Transcript_47273/g.110180 Transcript_47273/m.110180 type:complete len:819 (-) Transcript_47273:51-2507(-)
MPLHDAVDKAKVLPSLKATTGQASPSGGRRVTVAFAHGEGGAATGKRRDTTGGSPMQRIDSRSVRMGPMPSVPMSKSLSRSGPAMRRLASKKAKAWKEEQDEKPEMLVVCANCGQPGHLAMNCPNPKIKVESPRHKKQDKFLDDDDLMSQRDSVAASHKDNASDESSEGDDSEDAVKSEFMSSWNSLSRSGLGDQKLTDDRLETILSNFKFYNDLDVDTQVILRGRVVRLRERKGRVLFRQGDPAGNAYVILSGEAGIYVLRSDQAEGTKEAAEDVDRNVDSEPPPEKAVKCDPTRIKKVAAAVIAAVRLARKGGHDYDNEKEETEEEEAHYESGTSSMLLRTNSGKAESERSAPPVHMTLEGYSCYGGTTNLGERVGSIGAGDFFGEIALVYGQVRSATIKLIQDSELLMIKGSDFNELCRKRLLEQSDDKLKFLVKHVPGIRTHQHRRRGNQGKDVSHFWRRMTFPKGHTFLSQGSRSQPALYVVTTGTVEFLRQEAARAAVTPKAPRPVRPSPAAITSHSGGIPDAEIMHGSNRRRQYWGMDGLGFLGQGHQHQAEEGTHAKRDCPLRGLGERPRSSPGTHEHRDFWTAGVSPVRMFGGATRHKGGDQPRSRTVPQLGPQVKAIDLPSQASRVECRASHVDAQPMMNDPIRSLPRPASSTGCRPATANAEKPPAIRKEAQEGLSRMCHGLYEDAAACMGETSKALLGRVRPGSSSEASRSRTTKRVATLATGGLFGSLPLSAEEPFTVVVTSSTCEVLCVVGQECSKIPMQLYDIIKEYLADTTSWRLKNVRSSQVQIQKFKSASAPSLPTATNT